MTRYAMIADLRRCVGCQTCTAACKDTRGTPPGVQWRRVLDIEAGEYPDVRRVFVPTGCQHCDEPPCLEVCPSTATRKRDDGIVTIDESLCIGCSACMMACPYDARYKVDATAFAYGDAAMPHESALADPQRLGLVTKCDFCVDRVVAGVAKSLKPGVDPAATPVCAQSCISGALQFGDIDDPQSHVSRLLVENRWFRMHEEVGTGPGFYYLWDKGSVA